MDDKKEDVKKQKEDTPKGILYYLLIGIVFIVRAVDKNKKIIDTPGKFFLVLLCVGILFGIYFLLNRFAGVRGLIGGFAIGLGILVYECTFLFILGLIAGIALIAVGIKKKGILFH